MEFPCRAFLCACGGRYSPPPHAWGILPYLASRYVRGRFIPTCVGNTFRQFRRSGGESVHPHVRGEYSRAALRQSAHNGSSPRAWGILGTTGTDGLLDRFIPTCVGNTSIPSSPARPEPVHPHVRGEYCMARFSISWVSGSSPRAWGIPLHKLRKGVRGRFIPTCVGNTPSRVSIFSAFSVHPHVRGEYFAMEGNDLMVAGSSPRAWGILPRLHPNETGARFIPTCVGNTGSAPCKRT